MAQKGVQLDEETSFCSICLDQLKDLVTISCGHSYCMNCVKIHWDEEEEEKKLHSCPQCRQTFRPRPILVKNTMLADLVEQLKKTGLQAAPADHCYAGPEDVSCDFCTGRKRKAFKSCLICLVSYCEKHLQPHYDVAQLKKHKLVDPSNKLQENICSRHDEVMKMFCRTDQQCICYLCSVDEHKGHDTVSAAAERTERQRELEVSRLNIQQRIQDREKDVKLLQQEEENINRSADEAVEDNEKIFTELIRLMEKRSSDVKQQVRSQQRTEVSRVKELQEKLEQEISELKRNDAELQKLSHTEDLNQFLHNYPSLSPLSESTDSSSIKISPLSYFKEVTEAVKEVRDELQDVLREKWTNILLMTSQPITKQLHLKLALLNTQSLNKKSLILNKFITDSNLDFLCLTETWHKPPDYVSLNQTTPAGFTYIDQPRPEGRGGGVAAVYRRDIETTTIPIPVIDSFEHLAFKVSGPTPLVIAVIYRPEQHPSFLIDFSYFLTQLCDISPSVLLLGDFNIHIDNTKLKLTTEFLKLLQCFNFTQHINFPTHNQGHILDLVCSTGLTITHLSSLDLKISPHLAFTMDIDIPIPIPNASRNIHPFSSAYPGSGRGGSRPSRPTQASLSPATCSSSYWGTPRRSQASWEI